MFFYCMTITEGVPQFNLLKKLLSLKNILQWILTLEHLVYMSCLNNYVKNVSSFFQEV